MEAIRACAYSWYTAVLPCEEHGVHCRAGRQLACTASVPCLSRQPLPALSTPCLLPLPAAVAFCVASPHLLAEHVVVAEAVVGGAVVLQVRVLDCRGVARKANGSDLVPISTQPLALHLAMLLGSPK